MDYGAIRVSTCKDSEGRLIKDKKAKAWGGTQVGVLTMQPTPVPCPNGESKECIGSKIIGYGSFQNQWERGTQLQGFGEITPWGAGPNGNTDRKTTGRLIRSHIFMTFGDSGSPLLLRDCAECVIGMATFLELDDSTQQLWSGAIKITDGVIRQYREWRSQ